MSRTFIPVGVRRDLWFNAHGRCAMCNKPLYRDGLTMMDVNLSEYAHIIADSSNGPRGDEELSEKLAQDPSNLILLCKDHHKLIDDAGGVKKFGIELLRRIKKEHEDRIELVTGISPEKKSLVVCYTPKIGDRLHTITGIETAETLFPERYPIYPEPIRLDATNIPYDDNQKKYWDVLPDILVENFKKSLADDLTRVSHVSIFAIAPQPLLILLGTLIGDLYNVEIWQKHRETQAWKWLNVVEKNEFIVNRPDDKGKEPVLIFAISGSEIIEKVTKQLGENYSYWVVTCEKPDRDMMKTKGQLEEFAKLMRSLINEINESAVGKVIKVFPAMPISCAIMLGRVRLPKSDNPWELYDQPKPNEEYVKTITI